MRPRGFDSPACNQFPRGSSSSAVNYAILHSNPWHTREIGQSMYSKVTSFVAKSLPFLAVAVAALSYSAFKPCVAEPTLVEPEAVVTVGEITFNEPLAYIAAIPATPSVKRASLPRKASRTCGAVQRPLVQGHGDVAMSGDWGCPR